MQRRSIGGGSTKSQFKGGRGGMLNLLEEIAARLTGVAGPDAPGWYTAFCPFHRRHRAAQRLLEFGLEVVIPFSPLIKFPSRSPRVAMPLRPRKGGFLKPFGCGRFTPGEPAVPRAEQPSMTDPSVGAVQ